MEDYQIFCSAFFLAGTSFLAYVGHVYWLQAEIKAAKTTKATIFFISMALVKQKYHSFNRKQINKTIIQTV
jgi:hypothetical protein